MKILVTGSAGFIGFHLVKKLLSAGNEVVGFDNLDSYYDVALKFARLRELGVHEEELSQCHIHEPEHASFRFFRLSIEDKEGLDRLFSEEHFDMICNLAAQAGVRYSLENPQQYISTNIQGFFNILECCRRYEVTRLVFASSSSIYGKNTQVPYSEDDKTDSPVSLYAATKKSGELLAHCYSELFGIRAIGLRFFTVYGPWGRPDMAPFLFTRAILEGEPIKVYNRGDMFRDFTYVDDIVGGVCQVVSHFPEKKEGERLFRIYNIGNSTPVKLADFIAVLEELTHKKAICHYEPMQPGDVKGTWADVTHLKEDFDYAPATPLEVGLKAFVDWYKEYYYHDE